MDHMKLNIDYVQLGLHMRCIFDFRDKFDQIYDSKNYESSKLIRLNFIKAILG